MKVSLIITTRNEGPTIEPLVASIAAQSRRPDEVVVVDAGSSDGTPAILRRTLQATGIPATVVVREGVNIARGRNLAIELAQHELIAVTDGGCSLEPTWLENLERILLERQVEVVFGGSLAVGKTLVGRCFAALYQRKTHGRRITATEFSSRSVFFTREVWRRVGGYPENLTMAGEDTLFFLALQRAGSSTVCATAVTHWYHGYESLWRIFKVHYLDSIGSGEARMWTARYLTLIALYVCGLVMMALATRDTTWRRVALAAAVMYYSRHSGTAARQLSSAKPLMVMPVLLLCRELGLICGYLKGTANRHAQHA